VRLLGDSLRSFASLRMTANSYCDAEGVGVWFD
jgi:hypothetical protein